MPNEALRILIAASGTGGHLLPARYIAQALQEQSPGVRIEFVGSGRPLEAELIDQKGYVRRVIPARQVKGAGIVGLFTFLCSIPGTLLAVHRLLREFKPHLVVGVGGYVSVFPIIQAWLHGIPTWIHEAERSPGMATKVLSFFARGVSSGFDGLRLCGSKMVVHTGNPVRPELREVSAQKKFPDTPGHILILGGSQGADAIDKACLKLIPVFKSRGCSLEHQCRKENLEELETAYAAAGIEARVMPFIHSMDESYRRADLVISRSGAGAVAELDVLGVPAILIPYPHGEEQRTNAELLVNRGSAVMIEEKSGDLSTGIKDAFLKLSDPIEYKKRTRPRADKQGPSAAQQIAEYGLKLAIN